MWHQSQMVTHHLLLDSEGLKCHPHHIFSSEVSLLPNCCLRKTICRLFDHVFCPPLSGVSWAGAAGGELPGRAPPWFPHCSAAICSGFSAMSLISACRSVYFHDFACFFCALCRVIQVSLCFLDWLISKLCWLHLTDLIENDAGGVLMYIY